VTEAAELAVSEVFGPTIQGEGPSAGQRAGFVRLGRCNLDCVWCDTPYTWDWDRFDPAVEVSKTAVPDVVARLEGMDPGRVVVTGGEPLLQQRALIPLLEACAQRGWPVEVETNGTIAPEPRVADLVERFNVSPKTTNSGVTEDKRLKPHALKALVSTEKAVFKFVARDEADLEEIAALVEQHDLRPTWVMPEGTDAAVVTERMRTLADPVLKRGWHLTPRLHILLWGDERGR